MNKYMVFYKERNATHCNRVNRMSAHNNGQLEF